MSDDPPDDHTKLELRQHSRKPLWIGIVLTIAYLIAVAFYVEDIRLLWRLDFNDMGSFLGGLFAPLAFLWLVLGFFQQGEELRNSVDALRLQSEELRASVEQQRAMVGLTREQIDHIKSRDSELEEEQARRAQPRLAIHESGSSPGDHGCRRHTFSVTNTGAQCTDLRIIHKGPEPNAFGRPVLKTGDFVEFSVNYKPGLFDAVDGTIIYVDGLGVERVRAFTLFGDGGLVTVHLSEKVYKAMIQSL